MLAQVSGCHQIAVAVLQANTVDQILKPSELDSTIHLLNISVLDAFLRELRVSGAKNKQGVKKNKQPTTHDIKANAQKIERQRKCVLINHKQTG